MTATTGTFEQRIRVDLTVAVEGNEDAFSMLQSDLQERIVEYVKREILPRHIRDASLVDAQRGPSGSRYHFAAEPRPVFTETKPIRLTLTDIGF